MKTTKKGMKPLLILVAVTILVGTVGAALYSMYISNQFQVVQPDYGADALAIQASTRADYSAKIEATSLGTTNLKYTMTNGVILVILDYDLPDGEALIITPKAYKADGITPYEGWDSLLDTQACFVSICSDGSDDAIYRHESVDEITGAYIVRNADISKMVWLDVGVTTTTRNGIVLEYTIPEIDAYDPNFATTPDDVVKFEVTIEVEDAPPA